MDHEAQKAVLKRISASLLACAEDLELLIEEGAPPEKIADVAAEAAADLGQLRGADKQDVSAEVVAQLKTARAVILSIVDPLIF